MSRSRIKPSMRLDASFARSKLSTNPKPTRCSRCVVVAETAYPHRASKPSKSQTRFEYPHSLSYQLRHFRYLPPVTLVNAGSNIEEWELPITSDDTTGVSMSCKMPFIRFDSAADLIAA